MGSVIPSQLNPKWKAATLLEAVQMEPNIYELRFQINIHPVSLSRYFIVKTSQPHSTLTRSVIYPMRAKANVDEHFKNHQFTLMPSDGAKFEVSPFSSNKRSIARQRLTLKGILSCIVLRLFEKKVYPKQKIVEREICG